MNEWKSGKVFQEQAWEYKWKLLEESSTPPFLEFQDPRRSSWRGMRDLPSKYPISG